MANALAAKAIDLGICVRPRSQLKIALGEHPKALAACCWLSLNRFLNCIRSSEVIIALRRGSPVLYCPWR